MHRLTFTMLLLVPVLCLAEPVQWTVVSGGNGHYYEAVVQSATWFEARDLADQHTWQGLVGHLVTLTSAEEEAFLWSHFDGSEWWLGAYQPLGLCPPECDYEDPLGFDGGWEWVTGEEWSYTNWGSTNPDGGNEDCLMYRPTYPGWNDDEGWEGLQGYIVEYSDGGVPAREVGFSTVKVLY